MTPLPTQRQRVGRDGGEGSVTQRFAVVRHDDRLVAALNGRALNGAAWDDAMKEDMASDDDGTTRDNPQAKAASALNAR